MAPLPLDEDNYPRPLLDRPRNVAGIWRVVGLAAFFIILAVLLATMGDRIPADLILLFLGLLAVVGVFCLFGIAAGGSVVFAIAGTLARARYRVRDTS